MSLELVRESVKINRVVGEEYTQTIVETDIIVPDSKPDIARILVLDGDCHITGSEVIQDKVIVNGTVRFKILYISDDTEQQLKGINANSSFSCPLAVQGSRQGMKCRVRCDIEHIEHGVVNSRKINARTILNIGGKVTCETEQQVVCDVTGLDDVQMLRSSLSTASYLGSSETSASVREALEVPSGNPAIREILRNDVKISNREYKAGEDRIVARADINISTLYIADDESGSIRSMEHEIPFAHHVDLPGVYEDSDIIADLSISDVVFEAVEDSDGELRILNGDLTLNLWAEGTVRTDIQTVADVYGIKTRLAVEKELFSIEEPAVENRSQVIMKETVYIEDDRAEIGEVFNVLCKPALSEFRVTDGKLAIEGLVGVKVLYLANNSEQPVYCLDREIPVRHTVELAGAKPEMNAEVDLAVEHCNYSMISAREVELRIVLSVAARMRRLKEIEVIGKVSETALDDRRLESLPSLVIYFTQPGDSLWKIAKRYRTTIDDIVRLNSIQDSDAVSPGKQIIIPGKGL